MITISVLPLTEHLKRNQTSIKITVLQRVYHFTSFNNNLLTIIGFTVLAVLMRPFPQITNRIAL